MADLTVIGIDPGSRFTGWGIVREASGVLSLVDCGLVHSEGQKNKCFSARLARIYSGLNAVLGSHNPDEAAMEQVFTAKNAASALKLGQARGVAVAACAAHGLDVYDYETRGVKN